MVLINKKKTNKPLKKISKKFSKKSIKKKNKQKGKGLDSIDQRLKLLKEQEEEQRRTLSNVQAQIELLKDNSKGKKDISTHNILDGNTATINFSKSDYLKVDIGNDLSNRYKGWSSFKKNIRKLPYNLDKDKTNWLQLLDLDRSNLCVELVILSKEIPNGIRLYFENLKFKSDSQNQKYSIKFKNLLLNRERLNNQLFIPLPVTVPVISLDSLLLDNGNLLSEQIIPVNQTNHVNKMLDKKRDEGKIYTAFNNIVFDFEPEENCWYTNLTNIYQSFGFFYNNSNTQEDRYSKINTSLPFWDNTLDVTSANDINREYNKWKNKYGAEVGISGITINIKPRSDDDEVYID